MKISNKIKSKSGLAIVLSRLKGFEKPDARLEQYPTDSEIAAEILWFGLQNKDMEKVIVDLGCGTGILGIGALILGAKKVVFVDIDPKAIGIARENIEFVKSELKINFSGKTEFIVGDVNELQGIAADVVIENPPFGVKKRHADREFLERAFGIADIVYSFHKAESTDFIDDISRKKGFKATHFWRFDFPLKQTMDFHRKRIERIKAGCWRLERVQ